VLVVIGILIALQINNWNEEKKEHQRLISNLEEMRSNLIEDTLSFNEYSEFLDQTSRAKEILLEQKSFQGFSLDSLIKLVQPITDVNPINTRAYEKIHWSTFKKQDELDSLVVAIQYYYTTIKKKHDANVDWDNTYALKEAEYWYYHPEFELSYLESVDRHFPYLKSDADRLADLRSELGTIRVRNLIRMAIFRKNWVKRSIHRSKNEATELLVRINEYLNSNSK
jgi:hypothetical protein